MTRTGLVRFGVLFHLLHELVRFPQSFIPTLERSSLQIWVISFEQFLLGRLYVSYERRATNEYYKTAAREH